MSGIILYFLWFFSNKYGEFVYNIWTLTLSQSCDPVWMKHVKWTSIFLKYFFHLCKGMWYVVSSMMIVYVCIIIICCVHGLHGGHHNKCDLFIQPFTGTIFQVENAKIYMMMIIFVEQYIIYEKNCKENVLNIIILTSSILLLLSVVVVVVIYYYLTSFPYVYIFIHALTHTLK